MVIADTGFIVAMALPPQPKHRECKTVYDKLRTQIYVPQIVLAETTYLIEKYGGKKALIKFMQHLPLQKYVIVPLADIDIERATQIYSHYIDTRLDFVDASVIAMAERLKISTVLTLDHRDFSLVRPVHVEYLTLLPALSST
jgi:predicted nucleic acid-binding protein